MRVLGLSILESGIFRSSVQEFGIFSIYLIISYEKYPDNNELIGGKVFGILNLNSSIIFSIIFFGLPLIFILFFLSSYL